jgi:hypothetical protein
VISLPAGCPTYEEYSIAPNIDCRIEPDFWCLGIGLGVEAEALGSVWCH